MVGNYSMYRTGCVTFLGLHDSFDLSLSPLLALGSSAWASSPSSSLTGPPLPPLLSVGGVLSHGRWRTTNILVYKMVELALKVAPNSVQVQSRTLDVSCIVRESLDTQSPTIMSKTNALQLLVLPFTLHI